MQPKNSGKCNTANGCKLAVNICSVGSNPFPLSKYYYILLTSFYGNFPKQIFYNHYSHRFCLYRNFISRNKDCNLYLQCNENALLKLLMLLLYNSEIRLSERVVKICFPKKFSNCNYICRLICSVLQMPRDSNYIPRMHSFIRRLKLLLYTIDLKKHFPGKCNHCFENSSICFFTTKHLQCRLLDHCVSRKEPDSSSS